MSDRTVVYTDLSKLVKRILRHAGDETSTPNLRSVRPGLMELHYRQGPEFYRVTAIKQEQGKYVAELPVRA